MQMIMKKYLRFVLAALSLFAAVSCAKEVALNEEEQEKEIVVPDVKTVPYDLTVGSELTKSYISEKHIFWEDGDKLAVIDNVNGTVHEFTMDSFEGNSAKFTGELNEGAETLYVIYPYDENARVDGGGKITTTLPAVQTLESNNTAKGALVAVGTAAVGDPVELKNAFGLIQVTAKHSDISQIVVSGTGLSGEATFDAADGSVETRPSGTRVTLKPGTGSFTKDAVYYLAAVPGETEKNDFSVEMTRPTDPAAEEGSDLDGFGPSAVYTFNKSITIPRNGGFKFSTDNTAFSWAWHIYNKAQLFEWNAKSAMWSDTDKVYLEEDIDMNTEEWTPHTFRGVFDGQDHKLYNIVTSEDNEHTGLFAELFGTVKNLVIGSSNGTAYDGVSHIQHAWDKTAKWANVGSVCGRAQKNALIDHVTNFATIEILSTDAGKGRLGGIAAFIADENVTVSNCINRGSIINNQASACAINNVMGGIVASADRAAKLVDCTNYGAVTSNNNKVYWIGGIMGTTNGPVAVGNDAQWISTLTRCNNYGTVSATAGPDNLSMGGIVGYITGGTLESCNNESTGTVSSTSTGGATYIGGVAGRSAGENAISLTGCNNRANLTTDNTNVTRLAGIIGHVGITESGNTYSFDNCHNYGSISNTSNSTTDENRVAGFFATVTNDGDITSRIISVTNSSNEASVSSNKPGGYAAYVSGICAFAEAPISLTSVENNGTVSASYPSGTKTLNVGGLCGVASAAVTIASCSNTKKISANGGGIVNLGGFIGNCTGDGSSITGTSSSKSINSGEVDGYTSGGEIRVGGIAGTSTTLSLAWVDNKGIVHGYNNNTSNEIQVGGLLGQEPSGSLSITDSSNSGKVYAEGSGKNSCVAGGVGVARNVSFTRVTNSGEIYANTTNGVARIGGFVGWGSGFTINGGCINTKDAKVYTTRNKDSRIGGFAGVAKGGFKIEGSSANRIINKGRVYGNGAADMRVGGIIGHNDYDAGSIKYADNEGDISTNQQGGQNMIGGIAGHLVGALVTVENCNNTGNVSDEMSSHVTKYRCIGGIVGRAQGASGKIVSVKNCTNTGTISANLNTDNQLANCGGIVGDINTYCTLTGNINGVLGDSTKGRISCTNKVASTKTTRTAYAGGIFGGDNEGTKDAAGNNTVTGNTNYGIITATVTNGATTCGAGGIGGTIRRAGTFTDNTNYGNVVATNGATAGGPGAVLGYMEATTVSASATISKSITVGGVTYAAAEAAGTLATWLCPNNNNITATYVD